jgi:hypothetical protein
MIKIKEQTSDGFDSFIAEQRALPGTCTVTLAQFDDHYEEVYARRDIRDVPLLDLRPRGMTALLDSIGKLVHTTDEWITRLPEPQRPATVIVGILTDGLENASQEYTFPDVKLLITEQEQVRGWTFLYLGANQDAIEEGAKLGVSRHRSLTYNPGNVEAAYGATTAAIARVRAAVAHGIEPGAARDAYAAFRDVDRQEAARGA